MRNLHVYGILFFTIKKNIIIVPHNRSDKLHSLDSCTPFPLRLWEKLQEKKLNVIMFTHIRYRKENIAWNTELIKLNTLLWAGEPPYCKASTSPMFRYISINVMPKLLVALTTWVLCRPSAYSWRPNAANPKAYCATFVRSMQSIQFVLKTPRWSLRFAWRWPSAAWLLKPLHSTEFPYI